MNQAQNVIVRGRANRHEVEADYNELHLFDGVDRNLARVELWIAKKLGEELLRHYPGRNWTVTVSAEGGYVTVQCDEVSHQKGYYLSLDRSLDELTSMMMRVGGEILERGGLPRRRIVTPDEIEEVPRDFRDEVIGLDVLAPEERRVLTAEEQRRRRGQ